MKSKIRKFSKKISNLVSDSLSPKFKRNENANKALLINHIRHTYGDQKGQVDYLINNVLDYQNNGLFKGGFFIDLACADGISINNTYFLEKYLGWTGLLFEPNPRYKESIKEFRKTPLVTECVSENSGETVRFRIDNGMLGGIVSEETDNSLAIRGEELKAAEIIEINTTTLADELDKVGAPETIDFLSLDIEGAEWIALKSFPFDRFKFRCMAIERPIDLLDIKLEENGYRQVTHLMYDVIYVHQDYLGDVNFSPNIKFAFTPRKDW